MEDDATLIGVVAAISGMTDMETVADVPGSATGGAPSHAPHARTGHMGVDKEQPVTMSK